jgi:hypothetical protein
MENTIKLTAPEAQVTPPSCYDPDETTLVCLGGEELKVETRVFNGLNKFKVEVLGSYQRQVVRMWLQLRYGVAPTYRISCELSAQLCKLAAKVGDTQIHRAVFISSCKALADVNTDQDCWELLELLADNRFFKKEQKAYESPLEKVVNSLLGSRMKLERQLQIGIWLCEERFVVSCSGVRALFRKVAEDNELKARANYQLALCFIKGIDGEQSQDKALKLLQACPYGFAPAHLMRLQLGVPEDDALHVLGMFERSEDPAILFACARLAEHHASEKVREVAVACQKRAEKKDAA